MLKKQRILPGAEAFFLKGGKVGILLIHGFSGSPQSLRQWGEYLAGEGYTVSCPLLPGHGTTWQEMNQTQWMDWYNKELKAFQDLQSECKIVFVMGLSMGGTLALRLAEVFPQQIAGLVLVNPSVVTLNPLVKFTPLLKYIIPSIKGVTNDIKKAGVKELGYDRLPLKAFDSLRKLRDLTRFELNKISAPVLLFRSINDHVVEPINAKIILSGISSDEKEERLCKNSYHVATLDNDALSIFSGSTEFIKAHINKIE